MSQKRLCLFPLQKEIVAGFIRFVGVEKQSMRLDLLKM